MIYYTISEECPYCRAPDAAGYTFEIKSAAAHFKKIVCTVCRRLFMVKAEVTLTNVIIEVDGEQ